MKLNLKLAIAAFVMLIALFGIKQISNAKSRSALSRQANKVVVSTFTILNKNWQSEIQSIGNVKASQSIQISSEVPGIIANIKIESGQAVAQGQVLFDLRADTILADLEKSQVTLQEDVKNYERRKTLLPQHYISVADIDHCKALVERDESEVKKQKALLAQHTIIAPFSGMVGILQAQSGQYITPGQSLVNLESIDPVYVDFSVSEKLINKIKTGSVINIKSDAYPGELFTGHIIATSNAVDISNRSLQVRATVPNVQRKLLSGMAVNVYVNELSQNRIVIPQSALAYTPDGVGVYIIGNQNIAHWHQVQVEQRQGDDAVITSGLKIGDVIVVAGQQKIRDGLAVDINNKDLIMNFNESTNAIHN